MVGNKVFTLSTTRATHPANRRTLWAHVNRQYRAGGLYDIDATEDKGDAEDGEKKTNEEDNFGGHFPTQGYCDG